MMKKITLLVASVSLAALTLQGAVVLNLDGVAGFTTVGTKVGTSGVTTLLTGSDPDPDHVTSTYSGTYATNGDNNYSGPTMNASVYMDSLYTSGTATLPAASSQNFLQLSDKGVSSTIDSIRFRRNNNAGTEFSSGTQAITRSLFTFDAGGSWGLNSTSAFTLKGGIGTSTSVASGIGRWVVISDGNTYISNTTFDLISSVVTGSYSYSNATPTLWSTWTPNTELSNSDAGTFNIDGSTLTSITSAGFFFEKIGSAAINAEFTSFTADLANVPEPSIYALMAGMTVLGLVVLRRRRS